jgi:hypothetical protein
LVLRKIEVHDFAHLLHQEIQKGGEIVKLPELGEYGTQK